MLNDARFVCLAGATESKTFGLGGGVFGGGVAIVDAAEAVGVSKTFAMGYGDRNEPPAAVLSPSWISICVAALGSNL